MFLVCIAFWPIRFYWRILGHQRHLAIKHALNKQRFPIKCNRHGWNLAVGGTADLVGLLVVWAVELGLKKLGTEHGETLLVCPMDRTSLVTPGQNRTVKVQEIASSFCISCLWSCSNCPPLWISAAICIIFDRLCRQHWEEWYRDLSDQSSTT